MINDLNTRETYSEKNHNSEQRFNDDVQVIDYLNDLLSTTPSVNHSSNDIQQVQLAMASVWKNMEESKSAGKSVYHFESEQVKVEVEELRIVNKRLKFESELADIDAQVSKTEHALMRTEIGMLKEKMCDIQNVFNANPLAENVRSMEAENEILKSDIVELTRELNRMKADIISMRKECNELKPLAENSLNLQSLMEIPVDKVVEKNDPVVLEAINEDMESGNTASVSTENIAMAPQGMSTEPPAEEHQLLTTATELLSSPVTGQEQPAMDSSASDIITNMHIELKKEIQSSVADKEELPAKETTNKRGAENPLYNRAKANPKIIKDMYEGGKPVLPERIRPAPAARAKMVLQSADPLEIKLKLGDTECPIVVEPEITGNADTNTNKNAPHYNVLAEIVMEPAEVPKAVVRKTVKHYEELQKEGTSQDVATRESKSYS